MQTELFAGVVCIAPMISLEKVSKQGLNPYLRPIGSIFSAIAPRAAVVVVNRNTMYPDLQASFDQGGCCSVSKAGPGGAEGRVPYLAVFWKGNATEGVGG